MKNEKTPITFEQAVAVYPKLNDQFVDECIEEANQLNLDKYNEPLNEDELEWLDGYFREALSAAVNGDPGAVNAFGSLNPDL